MNQEPYEMFWIGPLLVVLVVVFALLIVWYYWHLHRRERSMLRLLHGAEQLEEDIKQCRVRLDAAHAAVNVTLGVPAVGSSSAHAAIDKALLDLLEHRLWIRDQAPKASQTQLKDAAAALEMARKQIRSQLEELDQAQQELDAAMHKHQQQSCNN